MASHEQGYFVASNFPRTRYLGISFGSRGTISENFIGGRGLSYKKITDIGYDAREFERVFMKIGNFRRKSGIVKAELGFFRKFEPSKKFIGQLS